MNQFDNSNVSYIQIEDTVLRCNQQAMEFMNNNNFTESAKLLLKANQILTNLTPTYSVIKLKAVTLNNLGCVYKRGDDNSKALHYLTQALDYEKRLPEEYTNIAGTHLNLCAIKSHLDDHNSALDHALAAVNIIQRNYTGKQEFVTTLVAAYHNAGIEYQFLNRKIEANNFFRQGFDLASKNLGKNHVLTKNIESMLKSKQEIVVLPKEKREKNRHETVFNPESRIFDEVTEKKIKVDTTPWPKFTEKKSWPSRVEPISQHDFTPKPSVQYPKHVKTDRKKDIQVPALSKFPERPLYNASEIDSDSSSKVYSKRNLPKQNYFETKPSDSSLISKKQPVNSNQYKHDYIKSKPQNIHLHHHDHPAPKKEKPQPDPQQNFRISTKIQPKSTKSLNSSPSKPSASNPSLSSARNPSISHFTQSITTEKIEELNGKLENLQEKLNKFEENFKKMKTLEEVQDDESVISTVSIVNNKKISAATMIQKHFRRYTAQKKFNEQKNAAIRIQKLGRAVATRRRVHRDIFKSEDFSQQFSIEPAAEPIFVKMEDRSNQTDVVIKKLKQGQIVLVSKQGVRASKKRKTLLENILLIQARIRGVLARRERVRRLKAIRVIQRKWRSVRIRNIFTKVVSAIVFIQAVFRGFKARKFAKSILPKGVIALVQSKRRW